MTEGPELILLQKKRVETLLLLTQKNRDCTVHATGPDRMPLGFVGMWCIENCAKSQNYETVPEMKVITVFYFPFIVASFWVILSLAFG